ncbi:MAG: translation initiation factor IF-2 [Alphaproteobacteria bacterium]|nr:translation initiation factor IF-2 [Alphaproteobacteria bacterium]MDE1986086.1 translation initiation factor IF-2 [Alphaproteobacteria bacterium]MDE2264416.1 translation initiation factor IF-2 [Alphaproteobacteria bacterium]MDE2499197.1 translation initiation factor IF-2 [Alphaproteobacteria bacterium]
MSDTNDTSTRRPGSAPSKTLSLKKTETSTVKQSFSHGRTKAVVVEKKRTRLEPGKPADKVHTPKDAPAKAVPAAPSAEPVVASSSASSRPGVVLRQLTDEEKARRGAALADARVHEEEARKRAEEDAKRRAEEDSRLKTERAAAAKRKAEEDARKAADELARKHAEEEASRRLEKKDEPAGTVAAKAPAEAPRRGRLIAEEEEETVSKKGAKAPAKTPAAPKKGEDNRRRGKLTVTKALSGDDERMRSVASYRRHLQRVNKGAQAQPAGPAGPREVTIPETITVAELANRMARRSVDVIKVLMKNGMMATVNDVIDADTAELVAAEYGHTVKRVAESDVLEGLKGASDDDTNLKARPPVVTVMGHVDHGKTSLLDALRKTDVVAGEAGGITQHIGAYQVQLHGGQRITFLDTPGHAAFTAMRARGAKVTDLVVLVVAADDGVMPQTVEAIAHAKAAHVPIIVAINKIDKGDADPMRVKTELLQHEIQVEDLGGETIAIEVSAKKGTNLDKLEEMILLQAEVLDLKANPDRSAEGAIIEAKLDRGRGPVATALVQRGTLKVGDIVVAGSEWGRVRLLQNDRGETVQSAGPATPVEVLGLSGAPEAGDEFVVVDSDARAREVTEYRARKRREARQATTSRLTLDQLLKTRAAGEKRLLPLVIKADVQGSAEAIQGALAKLGTDEVAAQVLQSGVGGITESDVILAHASGAAIIGFNVRADKQARERAKRDGVEIRYYNIIYNVVDDVKAALSGMLAPETREKFLGNAEILEVFTISKVGKVAGCRVTEGVVRRGAKVRLIRDHVVIHEGELSTLKRFKDEVREVQIGQECGMAFANYQDMQKGDVIEAFEVETIQRAL